MYRVWGVIELRKALCISLDLTAAAQRIGVREVSHEGALGLQSDSRWLVGRRRKKKEQRTLQQDGQPAAKCRRVAGEVGEMGA